MKHINKWKWLILMLLAHSQSHACINKLRDREEKPNVVEVTNRAVNLIMIGNYPQAIKLLEKLEQEHAGLAKTAANLGTALELTGQDEEALKWIKEAIVRDATEHSGTEWLHVRILETKLQLKNQPKLLTTQSVLELDFGDQAVPNHITVGFVDWQNNTHDLLQIRQAISYQLKERAKFVKPKDPVVADLFFDLANITWLTQTQYNQDVIRHYQQALRYGFPHQAQIKQRIKAYRKLMKAS